MDQFDGMQLMGRIDEIATRLDRLDTKLGGMSDQLVEIAKSQIVIPEAEPRDPDNPFGVRMVECGGEAAPVRTRWTRDEWIQEASQILYELRDYLDGDPDDWSIRTKARCETLLTAEFAARE
jgi:hypothetical protein